jgi:hypothetical protein
MCGLHIFWVEHQTTILAMRNLRAIVGALVIVAWAMCSNAQQFVQESLHVVLVKNYFHAGEDVWFSVHAIESNTKRPLNISKVAYVELLDSAGKAVVQTAANLDSSYGHGAFNIPDVPTGVYTLVAYTNWMKNFGETIFYRTPLAVVNGRLSTSSLVYTGKNDNAVPESAGKFPISSDKNSYGVRDKVRLTLPFQMNSARLSLSVYRIDSLVMPFHFGSEGKAGQTFATELPSGLLHAPEYNGRILTGRILSSETGQPVAGVNAFLTVVGRAPAFFNSVSDNAGNIWFEMRNVRHWDSVIVQPATSGMPRYRVEMNSPFVTHQKVYEHPDFSKSDDFKRSLTEMFINTQVQRTYQLRLRDSSRAGHVGSVDFFGKPDVSYLLDDYTRFSRMEEVFREYVAPVAVNKIGAKFVLKVYAPGEHATYEETPLVLIDGYPVQDINQLFEFDPLKIRTIDIVAQRYSRAGVVFGGIISMTTYSGNLNGYPVQRDALVIKNPDANSTYDGFVQYESDQLRQNPRPDFRSVLLWQPSVRGGEITFFTSDLEGTYVAVLQGLSGTGEPVSVSTRFNVKR